MTVSIEEVVPDRMQVLSLSQAAVRDYSDDVHPTRITVSTGAAAVFASNATHFMCVQQGEFVVGLDGNTYPLRAGCFGAFPGPVRLQGEGKVLVLSAARYRGPLLLGGPVEQDGRLRYIDGCTSSLLISPAVRGEPCLNFLHLPRNTSQTMHTHPSLRAGLILSGNGRCETHHGMLDFSAGTAFVIPPGVAHSFQSQDQNMRIVIYHPDSDSGPAHEDHTMLNRTFVKGESVQHMTELHTHGEAQS
jgi:mannose-6-phosphate isomerase-like protein (cupin superfamily)